MSTKRYFENPFEDFSEVNTVFEPNSCQLNNKTKDLLSKGFKSLLDYLEKNINKSIDPKDHTVYTGSTGFALLYLHLSHVLNDNQLLDKCLSLTDPVIKKLRLRKDDITFLLGSGVLSIGAVVHHLKGDQNGCNTLLNSLKSMVFFTTDLKTQMSDELLYGRSGFLYSLLFVRKLIPNSNQIIDNNDIRSVVDAILRSGQKTAEKDGVTKKCPLMYYWYKSPYVGAAHGLIGIMAILLEAKDYLTAEELNQLVKPTIDFILSIQLTSGNFPSGLDDSSDVLVHWCHGSPGAVNMLCLAFQTFKDERYVTAAKHCCESIWKRGLLKKGYGLCHGTAGNGYAFLRLYQLTDDPKYLYRAVKFGEWCCRYGEHGCRTPDTPFSMFEGMAGTVYYLTDLMDPKNSRFPAYQLS